jgi:hypothetical protein
MKLAHRFPAPAMYGSMDTGFPNMDAGYGGREGGNGLPTQARTGHIHTTIATPMDGTSTTVTGRMTITTTTIGTTTLITR